MPPPTLSLRACDVGDACASRHASSSRSAPASRARSRGCSGRGSGRPRASRARSTAPADGQRRRGRRAPRAAARRRSATRTRASRPCRPGGRRAPSSAQRRRHVVDVAEEVRERQRVERAVGERQSLRSRLRAARSARRGPRARLGYVRGEHLGRLIDADDRPRRVCSRQLDRHRCGAGRHVQPRARHRPGCARRGTRASVDPGRARATAHSGRRSIRAARTVGAHAGSGVMSRPPHRVYEPVLSWARDDAQRRPRTHRGGGGRVRCG